jgi:hypothetical protein
MSILIFSDQFSAKVFNKMVCEERLEIEKCDKIAVIKE